MLARITRKNKYNANAQDSKTFEKMSVCREAVDLPAVMFNQVIISVSISDIALYQRGRVQTSLVTCRAPIRYRRSWWSLWSFWWISLPIQVVGGDASVWDSCQSQTQFPVSVCNNIYWVQPSNHGCHLPSPPSATAAPGSPGGGGPGVRCNCKSEKLAVSLCSCRRCSTSLAPWPQPLPQTIVMISLFAKTTQRSKSEIQDFTLSLIWLREAAMSGCCCFFRNDEQGTLILLLCLFLYNTRDPSDVSHNV